MSHLGSQVFSIAVYSLTCLLGCFSNSLVVIAFCRNTAKQRFLANLDTVILNKASVNLLLCLTKDLSSLLHCFINNLLSDISCQICTYVIEVLRVLSLQSLILLSFLYYIKIRRANYKCCVFRLNCRSRFPSIFLGILWLSSLLIHLPYLGYKVHVAEGEKMSKTVTSFIQFANCMFDSDENSDFIGLRFAVMAVDLCSMVGLILLSSSIVAFLWKHRWKVVPFQENVLASRMWNRHTVQATKIILIFLFLYLLCWVSSYILWIIVWVQRYNSPLIQQAALAVPSIYYSTSSFALVFGCKRVRDQLNCCVTSLSIKLSRGVSTTSAT
ncbi:olfactory receptor class A-like protein 1 [Pleurodeles waltl]|uniref:olfactory receptor class A-like protein 1 n=1 Tax=Pleurodeles waltl TaxID=8319 RepID=UPI0037093EF7